jgi:gliding motility-associated-like protein
MLGFVNHALVQGDNPCDAPILTAAATCQYAPYSLPNTTTSTAGVPNPTCANYSGFDVWFQVVVPTSGSVEVDLNTQAGGPIDMGMAFYSATTCNGPFTQINCDDDGSNNGLMPRLIASGLTPGQVVFVRVWEYGGDTFGPFALCVKEITPPEPCIGGDNNSCENADPFCANLPSQTYCNTQNVPSMGQYSCLFSTPNPMWLFMEIDEPGDLSIQIAQYGANGNTLDVDFALYGPYNSIEEGCPSIGPGTATVDCSYSASNIEVADITNAQAGQIYILLVTNFSGAVGDITFEMVGGSGSTNCDIVNPCFTLELSSTTDVTCNSLADGTATIVVIDSIAPLTFTWSASSSTTSFANDLIAGSHSVTVTDTLGCTSSITFEILQPDPLEISVISDNILVCPGDSATLFAVGNGGSSTYSYLWTSTNLDSFGDTIHVLPAVGGQQYCLTLSEQCGSPGVQECISVGNPTPVVPMVSPNIDGMCSPAEFTFFNTSSPSQDIVSSYWNFGNGNDTLVLGNNPVQSNYINPQLISVELTVVSQFGCVYTSVFPDIAEVYSNPTANFYFTENPIYELHTHTGIVNFSSNDVVSWYWLFPGAYPTTSTSEKPSIFYEPGVIGSYQVYLYVENIHGCIDSIQKELVVLPSITFFAPNSFTPDGDEFNQTWKFYANGIDENNFVLRIFNRWGQLIWETQDPHRDWDGTYNGELVQTGVYTWYATVKAIQTDEIQTYSGMINLIR